MSNEKPVRGEVWDVDLDPVLGHEQGRKRPALVFRPSSIDGQRSPEFLEYPGLPVSRTCQSKIVGTLVRVRELNLPAEERLTAGSQGHPPALREAAMGRG